MKFQGVFLVAESYLQYFHAMYQHSDHSHIMHLLIEALGTSITHIIRNNITLLTIKFIETYMFLCVYRYVLNRNSNAYIWDGFAPNVRWITSFKRQRITNSTIKLFRAFLSQGTSSKIFMI